MEQIGPYQLVRIIGTGGMGLVWEAKQLFPVEREIALKVVRQGISASGLVERFDAERRSLAKMSHRGIVKVFEAGESESGQLYFAMELVSGIPLTDYCTEKKLSLHRRLELFLEAVLAVRHAHQKGVLHRDLKPSNILVSEDEEGRAFSKLIDFGIAKAVAEGNPDATLLTMPGQVVGTPQYMSPEQAGGGEVDTRTDVYGLGAVLYELISGSPPLPAERIASASTEEVLRMVREFEPERPSARMDRRGAGAARNRGAGGKGGHRWRRDLREELDWIALRCIEKDPERRYESVDGLVDDLRRYLDGSPVSARPPSRVYRARKFIRRNRLLVGSGLAILAALSTATVLSMRWAFAAEASRQLAETRLAQEDAVPEFLFKAFRHAGEFGDGTDLLALDVLRQAEKDVAIEFAEQPLIRARLQESIGLAYQRLGREDLAAPILNSALTLFRGVPGNEEAAQRLALPTTSTMRASGDAETAVPSSEAEWHRREKALGEDHPDTHRARLEYCRNMLEAAYWNDELRDGCLRQVDAVLNGVLQAPDRFPQAKVREYEAVAAQLAAGRGDHATALAFWDAEMDKLFLEGRARGNGRFWSGTFHVAALRRNGRLEEATAAAESLVLHCREFYGRQRGDTATATRYLAGVYAMSGSRDGAYLVCQMLQPEPDEQVDPLFVEGLDQLAQWSEQLGIARSQRTRLQDLVAEMKSGEPRATPEATGATVGRRAEILFWLAELCWARDRR